AEVDGRVSGAGLPVRPVPASGLHRNTADLQAQTAYGLRYPGSHGEHLQLLNVRRISMPTSTLTSAGQITLPNSVRDRLQLAIGDRVEFIEVPEGFLIRAAAGDIRELKGILGPRPHPVPIEQMRAAIAGMGERRP